MNCKQGDLALVIGPAKCPSVGKVVKCLRFIPANTPITSADQLIKAVVNEDAWYTDTLLYPTPPFRDWGYVNYCAANRYLLPLRPPAADETDTADQNLPAECGA